MKALLPAVSLLFCSLLFAADITIGNQTFHDAKISAVETTGIRITHRDGVAFVDFDNMPESTQRQYGYTAEKAKARHELATAEAAAVAERERVRAEAETKARLDAARLESARQHAAEIARQSVAEAKSQVEREKQEAEAGRDRERTFQLRRQAFWDDVKLWAFWICSGLLYFLPSIVGRKKNNVAAIVMLNVLAGWTFIGWVVAMVWACTKDAPPATTMQTVIIHAAPRPVALRPPMIAQAPRPLPRVVQAKPLPPSPRPPTSPPG